MKCALFLVYLHDGALKVCLTSQTFPTLHDSPNHPSASFKFPHREFGKKHIVKCSWILSIYGHFTESDYYSGGFCFNPLRTAAIRVRQ